MNVNGKHYITFGVTDSETRRLAVFLAQLIKEGVTYVTRQDPSGFEVELTGGF